MNRFGVDAPSSVIDEGNTVVDDTGHMDGRASVNRESTGRRRRPGSTSVYDKVDHAVARHQLAAKAQKAASREAHHRRAAERLNDANRPVWVGNIHPGTTEFDLQQLFSDCAGPDEITVTIRCVRGTPLIASDKVGNVWQPGHNRTNTVYASLVFPTSVTKRQALSKAGSLIHWNRTLQIVAEAGYLNEYRGVVEDSRAKLCWVSARMLEEAGTI